MKQRYRLYRRESGLYYSIDTLVNKRKSLNTGDSQEAQRLLNAMNEACREQAMNLLWRENDRILKAI